jgi:hypothetical protein
MPCFSMAADAPSEARKSISRFAAPGSLAPVTTAAANV